MSQHSVLPKRQHDSRLPLGCGHLIFIWEYFGPGCNFLGLNNILFR